MGILSNSALRKTCRYGVAPFRWLLPLEVRKGFLSRLGHYRLFNRSFLACELLGDFAKDDPAGFYRFLWSKHTGGPLYGRTYETALRFGEDNLRVSRRELIAEITQQLRKRGVVPERDVLSVFDAGCSLGYVLRYLEQRIFPLATCLRGMDVDQHAVETGSSYLREAGSKIDLVAADISHLDRVMGDQAFDVVLCCGVLMYLDEQTAARAVATLLGHTRMLLGVISLANLPADNSLLPRSIVRPQDRAFIHNVEAMIEKAGGKVVSRKWTGADAAGRYSHSPPLFTLAEAGAGSLRG